MAIFKGAGVAIVTPMKADGSVNYDKLQELIDYQIENGTDCIVICGTSGESSTLSEEEHSECIRAAVAFVRKRVPVVAGTGSNATYTAVDLTRKAEKDGVDAALIVTPYYNKANSSGLLEHYKEIARKTSLPIILYNVPSRTGVNITPEIAVELAKTCDNIVAVKEAAGDISQAARLMQMAEGCLDMYCGNDDQIVPYLSLGGIGVISVLSNICPRDTHDIVTSYLEGDVERSRSLQLRAVPLINELFREVNPVPVKTAMNLMGWDAGPLRLPLGEMSPENLERLRTAMRDYGLNTVL